MRNVSPQALAILSQRNGLEPLLFVEIFWSNNNIRFYSDRTIGTVDRGAILELSPFDDVVNFDGSSSSQSATIKLSDTDGHIKSIYNNTDIHKRRVNIYQWFSNLADEADKFLIFEGVINSPIVWSEGDRTLSFAIVSQIEDLEIGFSPEEGLFDVIPDALIGHAWPLPFGTVLQVPTIRLDPIPTGILMDAIGIPDPSIGRQVSTLQAKINELRGEATLAFYAALAAYHSGMEPGSLEIDDYWQQQGDQFTDQGNKFLEEAAKAASEMGNLQSVKTAQTGFARNSARVGNGECFQQGQISTSLNGIEATGNVLGGNFQIDNVVHPGEAGVNFHDLTQVGAEESSQVGGSQSVIQKLGFGWIPAGVPFQVTSALPVRYIVAMLPCTVQSVWAHRNFNNARILSIVPSDYYQVITQSFGDITATVLVLPKPLQYYNSSWEDDLFVDLTSPIGPNTVDIIAWLISTYTDKTVDPTSFNTARNQLAPFPSNFAYFDQKNIISALQEIAYQSRCALWLKNDVFFIKFLPVETNAVDTIGLSDIILNSLEITHTATENIVTKLTATYKTTYTQDKPYKIVLRNNIPKYGLHKSDTDWYIYNNPNLVDLAATFWLIRKSNTWKVLKFRTPLHKIRLETFDVVEMDFRPRNWSHIGPINGIVQSVKLDTDKLELEFEVWMPVRLGEMTKYPFAWPIDSDVHIYTTNFDFQKLGSGATGDLTPTNGACFQGVRYNVQKASRKRIGDGAPNPGTEQVNGQVIINPEIIGLDQTTRPRFNYDYRQYSAQPFTTGSTQPMTVPAQIVEAASGNAYKVKLYMQGINGAVTNTTATNVNPSGALAADTWVMVSIVTWQTRDANNRTVARSEKYFLPAIGKNVYPAQVTAGSGSSYTVNLFKNGSTGTPTSVSGVKQLQIDAADSVPVGTWCLVAEGTVPGTGGNPPTTEYTMQVPVWLE